MAFAYHTRAGTDGPGSLVGSGVGPIIIGGVMAYAMMSGKANESMAADLGVTPGADAPDLTPETLPVAPVHEEPTPAPEEKKESTYKPKQNPKPQTIALVGADAEYPRHAIAGARELVKKFGFKTVYDKSYPPSTVDYTPIARAIRRPPTIAPGIDPIPPTTAAVKPFRPARKPMKWKIWLKTSPYITPAAPASDDPMKNVDAITRSVSMPIIDAASRSYAVARIAFPNCVRATKAVSATMSAKLPMTTINVARETGTVFSENTVVNSGPGSPSPGFAEPRL